MKLAKLLGPEQILLDMKAVEHWPAIIELVDHMVTTGQLPPEQQPPFPRPPVRPNDSFRGLPQKANS